MIDITRLSTSLRSRGLWETIRWIYNGYFTVNNFIVFYKKLDEPFEYTNQDPSFRCVRGTVNHLQKIRRLEKKLPVEFSCDLTHHFCTPYLAFVDDKIAAIHWLVSPGEKSRFIDLKDGDVEMNYNTVLPQYRGRRIAEKLMSFMINSCTDNKSKRMFGVVNVSNIPQYKPMLRIGFEPVEVLRHFGFNRPKASLKYV